MNKMHNYLATHVVVLLLSAVALMAQNYPDTLWVPVTYYDFHADGSNPEFEMDHRGGVRTGLIEDTLDSDGKPISTETYLNWYIKYWYRDWADSAQGDNTAPRYDGSGNFQNIQNVGHDTSFKNIVIQDSLPFQHLGAGVYQYWNDDFFPLDGRGFGDPSGHGHNFSFAMELKTTFIMKEGLTFNFRGDDDVWAFVNGDLVMDLGNLHSAADGEFDTDTMGLTVGQEYDFDFFFAERHTYGSHIRITTNIVSTHIVTEVEIIANPDTAIIQAGDSVFYTGLVHYDSTDGNGTVHDLIDTTLSQNITWTLISDNPASDPTKSSLLPPTGMNSTFTTTEAYETFIVIAAYEDPVTHQVTSDTASITIIPDEPDHMIVEASSDTTSLLKKQNDTPMDTLTIAAAQTTGYAYGIIRDQYGNFVDYSQNTTWTRLAGTVIGDPVSGTATLGEGVVTKTGFSGTASVSSKDNIYYADTLPDYIDTFAVRVLNDVPVANDDNYSLIEDGILTVPSQGNPSILDNDVDNLSLTAILVDSVSVGNLNFAVDGSGSFTYVPPTDFNGSATFTYKVTDGEFTSNVATVTIVVGGSNDKPVAVNDAYSTNEDTQLSVNAANGVLNNDSDVDGDGLTAVIVSNVNPAAGSVTLNANGSFVYNPASNFNGTATFTYQANDGSLNSDVATVVITVSPVNDAPTTNPDSYTMNEDATLSISATAGVRANDSDLENDPFTVFVATNVPHGVLNLQSSGAFTYTPAQDSVGVVTFTYKATDGTDTSAEETVTITINPVNDKPIAVADIYTTPEDVTLNVNAANGVLSNDSDIEGSTLTATLQNDVDPSAGTLTLNSNGSFTFVPVANYNGPAYFTYTANDGTGASNAILVTINVTSVNDKPIAIDDNYSTDMNETLNVALPGVMLNDNDIDLNILKSFLIAGTGPANGTLTLNENGSILYIPATNDTGTYTFQYQLSDDTLYDTATVTLFVGLNNTSPVAVVDSYTVVEDNILTVSDPDSGVLANDLDSASDILSAVLVSGIDASEGTLVLNSNGTFTYTPAANLNGMVTFTYQASDSKLTSNIVTVYINVTPVNDVPIAVADNYSMNEDAVLTVTIGSGVISNDIDYDGDNLTANLVTGVNASQGTLTLNSGGNFVFTPAKDLTGIVTFTYKAYDGTVESDTAATVTITINPVNDIPILDSIPDQIVDKGTPFDTIFWDSVITDVDNDIEDLVVTIDSSENLIVKIDSVNGTIIVEPIDSNWTGTEIITITVTDPGGQTVSQDVTFIINKLSNLPQPMDSIIAMTDTSITVMYYVTGFESSQAKIPYTLTESQAGTEPADPKVSPLGTMNAVDTMTFGPYSQDSTIIKVTAFSELYPYESSSNNKFTYFLDYKQLPNLVADTTEGIHNVDTLIFTLFLENTTIVPDQIKYTLDGTDPETSSTAIIYDGSVLLTDTLLTQITVKAIATKKYYKDSKTELVFILNPNKLPQPKASPEGGDHYVSQLGIWLFTQDSVGVDDSLNYLGYDIRYTIDGTDPDKFSSKFTGNFNYVTDSIFINDNVTLKAVVLDSNQNPGPMLIEVYNLYIPTDIIVVTDPTDTIGSNVITVTAGNNQDLKVKILDQNGKVIPDSLLDPNVDIIWDLVETNGTNSAKLDTTGGLTNILIPDKAHNTVTITVTYILGSITFDKTITVIINPGAPHTLYLEPSYDKLVSPNEPNPIDTIKLAPSKTFENVYAILRDALGNYVSASQKTTWLSDSAILASVTAGNSTQGQAVITKQSNVTGIVHVSGQNADPAVTSLVNSIDSVVVQVLAYWYDQLRIVVNDVVNDPEVDTITFNTNLDSAVQVFGRADNDSTVWEKVSAQWIQVDKSLEYIIANPGVGHEYFLSPIDTASGRIAVTLGDDSLTTPDTIFAKFTPGGPEKVVIELITPDSLLIAGEPIKAVVKLLNADNKEIYGDYFTDSASYGDLFDLDSGLTDKPFITVNDSTYELGHFDLTKDGSIIQSFTGSSDTISFVLFHTKDSDDSVHQISVNLGLSQDNNVLITGNTKPFTLLASDSVAAIGIYVNNELADTVTIISGKGEVLKAHAIDQYGNKGNPIKGDWTNSTTLVNILYPDNTSQIYYEPGTTSEIKYGTIYVANALNSAMTDSIIVKVVPQPAKTVGVLTLDENGDGYLDAFEITFDIGVELSSQEIAEIIANTDSGIMIKKDGEKFVIKDIVPISGTDNKKYKIIVDSTLIGSDPQTDWKPEITISGLESMQIADIDSTTPVIADDGAAPVIWKVVNKKDPDGNIIEDEIQIIFSEIIKGQNGIDFNFGTIAPEDILQIWTKTDTGFVKVDGMLEKIGNFTSYDDIEKTITFKMTNGKVMGNNFFISLKDSANVDPSDVVMDASKNIPNLLSKKVQVVVSGVFDIVKVGPNPAIPSQDKYLELKGIPLDVTTFETAKGWVEESGGMIISIDLNLGITEEELDKLTDVSGNIPNFLDGRMMIFDVSGNLVYQKDTEPGNGGIILSKDDITDMVNDNGDIQTTKSMVFYWHGYTNFGMPAKPGVYKALFYFKIKGRDNATKLDKILAITK